MEHTVSSEGMSWKFFRYICFNRHVSYKAGLLQNLQWLLLAVNFFLSWVT